MKTNTLRLIACAVAGFGSLVAQQTTMAAGTYSWALTTGGAWGTTANWTKTGGATTYPSAAGDVVNLNLDVTAATPDIITFSGSTTPEFGILNWGDPTLTGGVYQEIRIGSTKAATPAVEINNNGSGAQINHNGTGAAYDNFYENMDLQDNLTVNVGNASYNVKLWGAISESNGGGWGITKTGPGIMGLQAVYVSNSYTGLTQVLGGNLTIASSLPGTANAIPGNILISGSGTKLQMNSGDCIADTANITFGNFSNENWNMGAPGVNNETIGSLTSSSGRGDIYSGGVLTLAATSGTFSYGGIINVGTVGDTPIALSKTGGSTQTLAGTSANLLTSVSVTGGILQLNKTAGIDALTGPITVGDGAGNGRIRLLAANQINDASTFKFNGGTLDTNGFSEKLSTLTNAGASAIDMGAGASILNFANSSGQSWSGSIQVLDWSGLPTGGGTDQLLFGTDATGLSAGQLTAISFVNPNPGIWVPGTYGAKILTSGEVVPVPEPAILGTVALSGLLALRRRRRVRA